MQQIFVIITNFVWRSMSAGNPLNPSLTIAALDVVWHKNTPILLSS